MENKKEKETIQSDINKKSPESINYSGNVIITIKNDKNTIFKKRFHNSGKSKLFEFLANCLVGTYNEALRPVKVKLFYNDYSKGSTGDTDWEKATGNITRWENISSKSGFIHYDTKGDIEELRPDPEVDMKNYKSILHFRIPFSFIDTSESSIINQICLYSTSSTETMLSDFSACYLFPGEETGKVGDINLNSYGKNYNIIVEWELSLANKEN